MESRRIFKRLKSYVIYRICVTVQVVCFLCIVSFVYNEAFEALFIILLALFHDLTIVTIAYDYQTPGIKPDTPTVKMLIFVAYTMGFVLSASSAILYAQGDKFLTSKFTTDFMYKQSVMFLQISNSSAILIFNARTTGFSFLSKPHPLLFASAIVSQIVVNLALVFGVIVSPLEYHDIIATWLYDLSCLKSAPTKAAPSRASRASRSRAEMTAKVTRRSGSRSQTLAGPMAGVGMVK